MLRACPDLANGLKMSTCEDVFAVTRGIIDLTSVPSDEFIVRWPTRYPTPYGITSLLSLVTSASSWGCTNNFS